MPVILYSNRLASQYSALRLMYEIANELGRRHRAYGTLFETFPTYTYECDRGIVRYVGNNIENYHYIIVVADSEIAEKLERKYRLRRVD